MIQFDMVIVGVGGQGILLASKILGRMALDKGINVKVSEVHGMAQRGGSVITHVRLGETVYAPLVAAGQADYVVAFEELEGVRSAGFLKKDGTMVVNTQQIWPMPVITGAAEYPKNPLEEIKQNLVALDALEMAEKAGSKRAVNVVLLGAAAKLLPFEKADWEEAIRACVPEKTLETNLKAFALGYNL
jgi:indolepyruvate ferredoxin oxidoreductase, beta subunit